MPEAGRSVRISDRLVFAGAEERQKQVLHVVEDFSHSSAMIPSLDNG